MVVIDKVIENHFIEFVFIIAIASVGMISGLAPAYLISKLAPFNFFLYVIVEMVLFWVLESVLKVELSSFIDDHVEIKITTRDPKEIKSELNKSKLSDHKQVLKLRKRLCKTYREENYHAYQLSKFKSSLIKRRNY